MTCTIHLLPDPACIGCQVQALTRCVEEVRAAVQKDRDLDPGVETVLARLQSRVDDIFAGADRRFNAIEARLLRFETQARPAPVQVTSINTTRPNYPALGLVKEQVRADLERDILAALATQDRGFARDRLLSGLASAPDPSDK